MIDDDTIGALRRLDNLRELLFDAIAEALAEDGHCKSYEGTFEIGFPNYFHDRGGRMDDPWRVSLHCYVVGPDRHYDWYGKTLSHAVSLAEHDVLAWVRERHEDSAQ